MIRIVAIICGVGMFAAIGLSVQPASAQISGFGYDGGYRFGAGLRSGGRFYQPSTSSHDRIPYFALHPPVYYSGIVPRPYGISPFAAPPGIRPVEMDVMPTVKPVVIDNPYFNGDEQPGDEQPPTPPVVEGETTDNRPLIEGAAQFVVNPYFQPIERLTSNRKR